MLRYIFNFRWNRPVCVLVKTHTCKDNVLKTCITCFFIENKGITTMQFHKRP
jgi:hypothetical protein